MKTHLLIALVILLTPYYVTAGGSKYSVDTLYLDTAVIDTGAIEAVELQLKQDGFWRDTCTRRSQRHQIFVPIKNNTQDTLWTLQWVMVWYDCGFFIRRSSAPPLVIAPGETKYCVLKVEPASKFWTHRRGVLPIRNMNGVDAHPGVAVGLKLEYNRLECRTSKR